MTASRLMRTALAVAAANAVWAAHAEPTDAQRAQAARRTVSSNPACSVRTLGPFYWEVGNRNGSLVSGSASRPNSPVITAQTTLSVASASKWVYAAYVVQKFGDDPAARSYLNLTSGYSNFRSSDCPVDGTVAQCSPGSRSVSEAINHVFHYDGGHMQRHAIDHGLGPLDDEGLTAEVVSVVGPELGLSYAQPGIAGGVSTNAATYAAFLRKLLVDGDSPLAIGALLGSNPVCTLPSATCPNASKLTAVSENWHYSLGHWIEDDPTNTPSMNYAYSSPGSFGFYPWVDLDRKLYGVLARQTDAFTGNDEGYLSVQCGRLIRLAWKTGVVQ